VFFNFIILLFSLTARALDLGPHLRVDEKSFRPLEITAGKILILTRSQCSFCEQQLKKLDCFNKNEVVILFDKGDEETWKKNHKIGKIPFPVYLTTKESLSLFKKTPVYPTTLVFKEKNILRLEGVKDCSVIQNYR
jgi:thioredoxin-related protein